MATATADPAHHAHTVKHFGRLAGTYDHRHHHYNQQTLSQALEVLRLSGTERVLDIGCGTGELERLIHERHPRASLVGLDVTPDMLAVAREKFQGVANVTFLLGQAETLPFAPASFDIVVSCNMLHHVRSVEGLLRECARVLRPGGCFVLIDWSRDFWHCRLAHYWLRLVKPSYVKMYRAAELAELVAPLGLAVASVHRFFVPPFFGMMRMVATRQQAVLSKITPSACHPAAGDAEPGPPGRPEPTTAIVRRGEDGRGGAAAGPAAGRSSTEQQQAS